MFHHEVSEGKVIENRATAPLGMYKTMPKGPEVRPGPVASTGSYLDSESDSEIEFTPAELKQINDYFQNKMYKAAGYTQPSSFISDSSEDDQPSDAWSKIDKCFRNIDEEMDYVSLCIAEDDWEEFGTFTLDPKIAERLNGAEQYCSF